MKLVHVCTRFTNWTNMTYDSFIEQDITHIEIPRHEKALINILQFIKVWDDYHHLSFFDFRQGLKRIAESTFEKMRFDDIIELRDLPNYACNCPYDCYFLISDDDDWYNPAVSSVLRTCNEDIVSWDDVVIAPSGRLEMRSSKKGKTLWTNSWAMRRDAYLRLTIREREKLKHHVASSRVIFSRKPNDGFTHRFLSDHQYSVACKTPASYCKYGYTLGKKNQDMQKFLHRCKEAYEKPEVIQAAKWAKGQIDDLTLLFDALYGVTSAK